jgi:hypothetical protein
MWVLRRKPGYACRMDERAHHRSEGDGPAPTGSDQDAEDDLETMIEQMDRPMGSDLTGTTAGEQRRNPSLTERVAQERARRVDRVEGIELVEDAAEDEEAELVGDEAESDDGDVLAPEERAMREAKDVPGGSWHDGDDYVE